MTTTDTKFRAETTEGQTPLADDEPTFVFRAADIHLPDVLQFYADECEARDWHHPGRAEHVKRVLAVRQRVLAWQEAHPDLVKRPD